jgi:hypothetical protein
LKLILCMFIIISPLKRTWPFTWTNMSSLHAKMTFIKFYWNWFRRFLFFPIQTRKIDFPYGDPTWSLETIILINLTVHFVIKLSCKLVLFWLSGSW